MEMQDGGGLPLLVEEATLPSPQLQDGGSLPLLLKKPHC